MGPLYLLMVCVCFTVLFLLMMAILLCTYQYFYWKRRRILHYNVVPYFSVNTSIYLRKVSFPGLSKRLYELYPNARYYGTFDFDAPMIVVRDPDLIRKICIQHFECFPDHRNFVSEDMDPIVGRNVFSLKGKRWKEVRNTLSPSFTATKMKIMFQLISECSRQFVQYFVDNPEMAKGFDAKDVFTRYTNDVIATAAFGVQVDSMRDPDNDFYKYGRDATSFSNPFRLIKFLLFRCFPKLLRMTGETFLSRPTNRFFNHLVTSTVRIRDERGIIRPDMIQLLMECRDKDNGIEVTIDDIIGQAFIFFLAGFETTSILMCFSAFELAAHTSIQEKLREEIDEYLEQADGEVTYDSLNKMKYLDMVIKETLRLYPPSPTTDRVCASSLIISPCKDGYPDYEVEVGTNVLIPIFGIQRDAQYFPDPMEFKPERFSDENKNNINPYAFIPFGLGPRKCIGNRFALMETKILLVHILKNFILKLSDKAIYPPVFCKKTFNMTIENGFSIKFEERKKVT